MQYIVDGIGFTLNWIEFQIAVSGSRYAVFDVPAGYKLALDFRLLNPSAERCWYHVYPQGTYTLGTAKPNDATGLMKVRNLRQDATFNPSLSQRYNVSAAPARLTDSIVDIPDWGVAGSASGNKAYSELAPDSTFLMLDGNQQFLLQLYNGGAGQVDFQLQLNFALIPEALVSPPEV